MQIVYIAAGAGGMYCGACARDVTLLRGLLARGHDARVIPLYTPLRSDTSASLPVAPIHYGGINVFLQQLSGFFRHTPAFLDRLLDQPGLLAWVSRFAIKTRAEDVGAMAVSVLAGRDGQQRKELTRLLEFIRRDERPDVVSLTNSLLSGIAPAVKQQLGVPVACALQGEDTFVESMLPRHREQAQALMRRNARSIDLFLAPGDAYAEKMADFLAVPRERIRVVHAGVDPAIYRPTAPRPRDPFTLGYLSVITPGKGLDLLVAAFRRLVQEEGRDLVLRVAGKVLKPEYWAEIQRTIAQAGLTARVEFLGEVDLDGKLDFLRRCSAFSVPSRFAESRGLAMMEAMAAGVPVIAPAAGIYPEALLLTGGGLLVPPEDPASLARAIARLMDEPEEADDLGRQAAHGIARHYGADLMVNQTLEAYAHLLAHADVSSSPATESARRHLTN